MVFLQCFGVGGWVLVWVVVESHWILIEVRVVIHIVILIVSLKLLKMLKIVVA